MGKVKIDKYLKKALRKVNPEEKLYLIISFHKEPTQGQLEKLVSDGVRILYTPFNVFNNMSPIYRGVVLPAKSVKKIRKYDFIEYLELSTKAKL